VGVEYPSPLFFLADLFSSGMFCFDPDFGFAQFERFDGRGRLLSSYVSSSSLFQKILLPEFDWVAMDLGH